MQARASEVPEEEDDDTLLVLAAEGSSAPGPLPAGGAAELAAHAAHFARLARPAPVAVGALGYALDLRQAAHALGVLVPTATHGDVGPTRV